MYSEESEEAELGDEEEDDEEEDESKTQRRLPRCLRRQRCMIQLLSKRCAQINRANSRSRQLSVLASFPRTSLISLCQKMQHRTALTPKNCPGQLSQVPTLKRLREYGR